MPVVWTCREHLGLFPAQRVVDMKALLICTLATSMVWALLTYVGFITATDPTMHLSPVMLAGTFVGTYVAILTIITWPLFFKIARNGRPLRAVISSALNSPLAFETAVVVVPLLAVVAFISTRVDAGTGAILQWSLFIPVAWITLKFGWRGAAATGPLAVAAVCILTQSVPDPVVIQTQAFVAFAVTFLFVMGARIASQLHAQEQERLTVRKAIKVVQQSMHHGELRLRQTSHALEMVGGSLTLTQSRIIERLRHVLTDDEKALLAKQASAARNQIYGLAESLHPISWRQRGLPAALRESIGRALDECGVAYEFDIQGRGLSQLAPTVHQAIYRIACECISQVCEQLTCSHVKLILRGGEIDQRRWAVLHVTGVSAPGNLKQLARRIHLRTNLSAKLGVASSTLPTIEAQAALFDGIVHTKRDERKVTMSVLLNDAQHLTLGHQHLPPTSQLWVR
jgi:glucose-6-phosphate-specific signal transduction histidine kinase